MSEKRIRYRVRTIDPETQVETIVIVHEPDMVKAGLVATQGSTRKVLSVAKL